MKEFNRQQALAGDPVVTQDGCEAKFLSEVKNDGVTSLVWMVTLKSGNQVVVLTDLSSGQHCPWDDNDPVQPCYNLFMAPVKKQEWRNIQYNLDRTAPTGQFYTIDDIPFESEEAAKKYAEHEQLPNYVKSILIREWEE